MGIRPPPATPRREEGTRNKEQGLRPATIQGLGCEDTQPCSGLCCGNGTWMWSWSLPIRPEVDADNVEAAGTDDQARGEEGIDDAEECPDKSKHHDGLDHSRQDYPLQPPGQGPIASCVDRFNQRRLPLEDA